MYEHHFGLDKPPFRITPDPAYFFPGGNRGAVLEALVYAVSRGEGIVKVTGEVGSGKTMLCRMLERELPANCELVYLANPSLGPDEILHAIAFELKLPVRDDDNKLKVLHALHDYLLEQHAEDRRVVLFVEEAQAMPLATLEEVRMLSNLETSEDKLLQIVLFGQPELDEKLNRHDIRQLRERITHAFELTPLGRAEIQEYLGSRLRQSGYRGNGLFDAAAVRELERHSLGLLRRINVIADKSLLAAFADQAATILPTHVRRAARDSNYQAAGEGTATPTNGWSGPVAGLALLAVAAAGGWMLMHAQEKLPHPASPQAAAPATLAPPKAAEEAFDPVSTQSPLPLRSENAGSSHKNAGDGQGNAGDGHGNAGDAWGNVDNQTQVPRISPQSGLVTTAHLRPRARLETPPQPIPDEP